MEVSWCTPIDDACSKTGGVVRTEPCSLKESSEEGYVSFVEVYETHGVLDFHCHWDLREYDFVRHAIHPPPLLGSWIEQAKNSERDSCIGDRIAFDALQRIALDRIGNVPCRHHAG